MKADLCAKVKDGKNLLPGILHHINVMWGFQVFTSVMMGKG
jgi:hypothetical protein